MPGPMRPTKTIDDVLEEFLDEQEGRWSPATFEKYEIVVGLLKRYMETYWPEHDGEQERVRQSGGTFCGTYGPEEVAGSFATFLDWYVPHKVLASEGTLK